MSKRSGYIEIAIHGLLLLLLFSTINVDWTANWFDRSLRPNTPAPLSVWIFLFYCYVNAFWLIPRYFNREQWPRYLLFGTLVFFGPELLRAFLISTLDPGLSFSAELQSKDSLILGTPSPFFMAVNLSFGYRFTKDWFVNRRLIRKLNNQETVSEPIEPLIAEIEAQELQQRLATVITQDQPFLDPNLSLRDLAAMIHTTDKKLSYLLNQYLSSNFYDYINRHRIEAFKTRIKAGDGQRLSIVGLAGECGFSSKSSFYRTFKKQVGISPSEYLAKLAN